MLSPEELEVESLNLNLHDDPEIAKALYGYVAEFLNEAVKQMIDEGALEMEPIDIINALIVLVEDLKQVSAL